MPVTYFFGKGWDTDMDLCQMLPVSMRNEIPDNCETGLEEVRMRVGWPTELLYGDNSTRCLPKASQKDISETLNYLSGYSLYALASELRQGFFTAKGGHRVGICGRANPQNAQNTKAEDAGQIQGIVDVSGLNIRIAHERKDCAKKLMPYLRDGDNIHNTLILAKPGVGKTTYLRDCIRLISTGDRTHPGLKVSVVDERSEIAACYRGVPQNDLGPRVDVLDNCPKVKGMRMLLRAMSPQVIAVDELGGEEDFAAVFQILYSGSRILGTIHAENIDELSAKPYMEELLQQKKIGRFVVLSKDEKGRRSCAVYDQDCRRIC